MSRRRLIIALAVIGVALASGVVYTRNGTSEIVLDPGATPARTPAAHRTTAIGAGRWLAANYGGWPLVVNYTTTARQLDDDPGSRPALVTTWSGVIVNWRRPYLRHFSGLVGRQYRSSPYAIHCSVKSFDKPRDPGSLTEAERAAVLSQPARFLEEVGAERHFKTAALLKSITVFANPAGMLECGYPEISAPGQTEVAILFDEHARPTYGGVYVIPDE